MTEAPQLNIRRFVVSALSSHSSLLSCDPFARGEVSERPKEQRWKRCVRFSAPRVRIPPSPPLYFRRSMTPEAQPVLLSSQAVTLPLPHNFRCLPHLVRLCGHLHRPDSRLDFRGSEALPASCGFDSAEPFDCAHGPEPVEGLVAGRLVSPFRSRPMGKLLAGVLDTKIWSVL